MSDQSTPMRVCSKCHVEQPISDFKPRNGRPGHWCRSCWRAYARNFHRKTHPLDNSAFEQHFASGCEYRDVVGFPGYRVGTDGSVWSCWRSVVGKGHEMSSVWSQLSPDASDSGHLRVPLYCGGIATRKLVHHLVLEAFIGPRPDGMEACHFPDSDPANNHLSNLRWDTKEGNWRDRKMHGNAQSWTKLSPDDARKIKKLFAEGIPVVEIASKFDVSDTQVRNIVTGKQWKGLADAEN